ncbi:Oidioi.mRNA.OKI2018_I69.chr2.g6777.t1.cds [Oikopleura dioica]|uniref:Oidioi.mRNA.OKI2018_I69.chr2.g6777.t1.cds n=1 Tax=Oikopleura dioica TaxID=34765 RepID=A0ABN7T434_OIKDI|nr:Oidioi.mRNA.OKI2018_I69.chr2.g6777.t1.cds [Oikopleura dioica]
MNKIEDDLMTELTDLTLKDISTLEKGMQSLVREEVRRYKLETELKNQMREEAATKTIRALQARIAELEATVARLTPTNAPYIAKNSVPAGEIHDNSLAEILKLQYENASNSQKYPDIQTLQTPGYASVRLDANLDAIERRNQKIKQALNMQGSNLGMTSNGEYYVHI